MKVCHFDLLQPCYSHGSTEFSGIWPCIWCWWSDQIRPGRGMGGVSRMQRLRFRLGCLTSWNGRPWSGGVPGVVRVVGRGGRPWSGGMPGVVRVVGRGGRPWSVRALMESRYLYRVCACKHECSGASMLLLHESCPTGAPAPLPPCACPCACPCSCPCPSS